MSWPTSQVAVQGKSRNAHKNGIESEQIENQYRPSDEEEEEDEEER